MKSKIGRRNFIGKSALLGVGLISAGNRSSWSYPAGSNDTIRVGVIGLGWIGPIHLERLQKLPGIKVVALCDVDPANLSNACEKIEGNCSKVFKTTDARRVLDRSDVDAVVISTCDHWHALLTVWACQAGKDVYVEKPVSHTVWEGQKMLEAEQRYNRIVQVGTQSRSDVGIPEISEYLQSGQIGPIKWAHALYYRKRSNIGLRTPWYPTGLDYDMYCGPTPMVPLRRDKLHYDWHWVWRTGGGDSVNIGIHVLDMARMLTGKNSTPNKLISFGGRFLVKDAAENPNTQFAVYEFDDFPLYMENRGLHADPEQTHMDVLRGIRKGVVIQCEGGYFAGYSGGKVYDNKGKHIQSFQGDGGNGHFQNFFDTIRSRNKRELAAPLSEGCLSSSMANMGNISFRLGQTASLDEISRDLDGHDNAQETLNRIIEHLQKRGIDLRHEPMTKGQWLHLEAGSLKISGTESGDPRDLDSARSMWRGVHRLPYTMPEEV